jgi:hypothetical protein
MQETEIIQNHDNVNIQNTGKTKPNIENIKAQTWYG